MAVPSNETMINECKSGMQGCSEDISALDITEMPMLKASLDDFDPLQIIRLRTAIEKNRGEDGLLRLDDESLLEELGLVIASEGKTYPTYAGMLLLAREEKIKELLPNVEYAFQAVQGTRVRVNQHYQKPLMEMLEILEFNAGVWNFEDEVMVGFFRLGIPRYSMIAVREGLINAISHRDYTVPGAVRIQIDNEGIVIDNPGSFIDGYSINTVLREEPKSRNPHLSNVLKRIGLTERSWRGIAAIFEESIRFGRPWPDYSESTSSNVRLYLPDYPADKKFTLWLLDKREMFSGSRFIKDTFSMNAMLILSLLRTGESYSAKDLAKKLEIGMQRTEQNLNELLSMNMIQAVDTLDGKKWILDPSAIETNPAVRLKPTSSNFSGTLLSKGYSDPSPSTVESLHYPKTETEKDQLILNYASQNGSITTGQAMDLLGASRSTCQKKLQNLAGKSILIHTGRGSSSKYLLAADKS